MSEGPANNSFGILKSLKRLIFEDGPETAVPEQAAAPSVSKEETKSQGAVTNNPQTHLTQNTSDLPPVDVKQMKLKVLEMLEKLNEPGIDFFEVWNAAAAMGSVDAGTIKAAFTSLKYVEKSLDKERLLSSGRNYAAELKKTIDQETRQKQGQKETIEQNLVREKESLNEEIKGMEKEIEELREKLASRQKDLKEINGKYEPQLQDIDRKIATGNTAVNEIVIDIENALRIIETNIN